MKQSRWIAVIITLAGYGLLGCGGSASSTAPSTETKPASHEHEHDHDHDHGHDHDGHDHGSSAENDSASAPQQRAIEEIPQKPQAEIAADAAPEQVVHAFFDSLRSGSEQVAGGLLTDRAWQETNKEGFVVQPPGTPGAQYTIGETRFVTNDENGAHVASTWTETFEDGSQETYDVTWVLRHEAHGWRIAGMATTVAEGGETLFLNFEDPRDMLSKWEAADTAESGEPAALQAQNTGSSASPITR